MLDLNRDDLGRLLLRLAIGGMMLFHGIAKLRYGLSPIEGMLEAKGLPAFMAYGAYVGELLAPAMIVAGVFSRFSALAVAGNMVMAIALAHSGDLLSLNPSHGGWAVELPMLYLLGAVTIALLGSGRFAFRRD